MLVHSSPFAVHWLRHLPQAAAFVAAAWACRPACGQWSFTVDPTFQVQLVQQNVNSLLLNEDGTLIASGRMRLPGETSDKTLCRFLPNGIRDATFNNSGMGGGKLVRWEDKFFASTGVVRRLNMDGTLDAGFSMQTPYFGPMQGGDYHIFPDGRVLISGNHMLSDSLRGFVGPHQLIWFTNTGSLDTTRTHRRGGNCAVYRFKELPNGQFICSGLCNQFDGQEIDRIFRVHADGSVDTTFSTGVFTGSAFDYLPLDDGRVYVGGNFRRTEAPNDTLRLVRFLPDGELDPTFNIPQFIAGEGLSTPLGATVHRITPWHNGTLIITGQFKRVNDQIRKGICMIDPNGQLLDVFNDQGVGPFTFSSITNGSVFGPVFNADSTQMYICGTYSGYNDGLNNYPEQRFITRLNVQELSVGVQEQTLPQATLLLWPNPSNQQTWLAYSLPGHSGPVQLRIRDAQGRLAHTLQASGEEGQVVWDTRDVAPGVYTVELLREGKLERTERLVIQQ